MDILYFTILNELDKEKCGILGKIKGQIEGFKKQGYHVHFGHFSGTNRFVIENGDKQDFTTANGKHTRARLASIYDWIYSYIEKYNISVLYIRFSSLDKNAIDFYRKVKKINTIIVIEFYSHNLELEAKKTIIRDIKSRRIVKACKGTLSYALNKCNYMKLKQCIDAIVTTTEVDSLYGVQTINVVNGINSEAVSVRNKKTNDYDFNIISVAMISAWHGYDRAIKGLAEYYAKGGEVNILYTVIGDGEEKGNLEKLVKSLHLEKHVIFTGIKLTDELDEYYDQADIALEMLAGFRRTNGTISSIKMAEYFAKGIPVVYASGNRINNADIEKYCYLVPNNDSPIDIEGVIRFSKDIYDHEADVANKMHSVAKEYFDWTYTMRNLYSYLEEKTNQIH